MKHAQKNQYSFAKERLRDFIHTSWAFFYDKLMHSFREFHSFDQQYETFCAELKEWIPFTRSMQLMYDKVYLRTVGVLLPNV